VCYFDIVSLLIHTYFTIQGKNLGRGARIYDYRVVIGNRECIVRSLSDNLLSCEPPYNEPHLSHDDPYCGDYNSIKVCTLAILYDVAVCYTIFFTQVRNF